MSTVSSTGTGARRVSAASAAGSPSSVRMAGWMPRASARSSASASTASVSASTSSWSRAAPPSASSSAGELEREPDPEQVLLGAVVEVALEPASLVVAGFDDAGAGGADLGELGAQLGLEARVLERERRGGADRLDELGVVEQRGVVDERGEPVALVLEHRDGAAGLLGEDELASVGVDVASRLGEPEGELERGVAERARDRVPHLARLPRGAELDHQPGDPRPVHPRPQQTHEERDRNHARTRCRRARRPRWAGSPPRRVTSSTSSAENGTMCHGRRQQDGGVCAAGRPRRPTDLPHEEHRGGAEDRHRDEQRDEVERVEQRGIPADQQQVARASRALAVSRADPRTAATRARAPARRA